MWRVTTVDSMLVMKCLKVQMDTQVGCYMQVTYNRWYIHVAIIQIMTNIDIRDAENSELVGVNRYELAVSIGCGEETRETTCILLQ
jgi:hypothetical protein